VKVLFLNHNTVGYGTYYRCFFLGKHLSQHGIEVTMLTSSNKNYNMHIKRIRINNRMTIVTLPYFKVSQYCTGHLLRAVINSIYTVLSPDFDIIHSFVFPVPSIAMPTVLARFLGDKPIIIDGDDLWRGGWAEYHNPFTKMFLEKAEDMIPHMVDRITVVSEVMKNRFLGLGISNERIRKIPNGSNVDQIRPMNMHYARRKLGFGDDERILSAIGHTYTNSLFILLDAFKKVARELPDIKLLMVGQMALSREAWNEVSRRYGELLGKQLLLIGEQPYERVLYYMAVADALLLPMDDNPLERARFPMRFGDYLASGRPIISNAVGEVKSILEDNVCGLTSEPDSAERLAENILIALRDRELTEEYGRRARKVAEEKLAWSKVAGDLLSFYEELLYSGRKC